MKHYSLLFLYAYLSFVSFITVAQHYKDFDQLLVVVIMVKNEEAVMCDTLQPYVDAGVDAFFVFDTGSSDRTIQVTEQFFKDNGVEQGCIAQEPFVDFSTSRNRALQLAHERFPKAAFMLMPDAEWYMVNAEGLLDFCRYALDRGDYCPCYLVRILNDYVDFYVSRLIRCHSGVEFSGVVHEAITTVTGHKVFEDVFFEWLPSETGVQNTQARFKRDRVLLEKELEKNPIHTRTLFYLARVCADLGDFETAYMYYKRRIMLVGWPEEDFAAYLNFARVIERLSMCSDKYTWSEALECYLKAYQMRPHRAEPLVALADHYVRSNQMALAFLFAQRAAEIAYPDNDLLFVQKYEYDYYRYELLARSAWYVGEFEIGYWGAQIAVEYDEDNEAAQKNLEWYERRLGLKSHATNM